MPTPISEFQYQAAATVKSFTLRSKLLFVLIDSVEACNVRVCGVKLLVICVDNFAPRSSRICL